MVRDHPSGRKVIKTDSIHRSYIYQLERDCVLITSDWTNIKDW